MKWVCAPALGATGLEVVARWLGFDKERSLRLSQNEAIQRRSFVYRGFIPWPGLRSRRFYCIHVISGRNRAALENRYV
jgi:hypothetical protein